jgi:hypothetical protein
METSRILQIFENVHRRLIRQKKPRQLPFSYGTNVGLNNDVDVDQSCLYIDIKDAVALSILFLSLALLTRHSLPQGQ